MGKKGLEISSHGLIGEEKGEYRGLKMFPITINYGV